MQDERKGDEIKGDSKKKPAFMMPSVLRRPITKPGKPAKVLARNSSAPAGSAADDCPNGAPPSHCYCR